MLHLSMGNTIVQMKEKYWVILERTLFALTVVLIAALIYAHSLFSRQALVVLPILSLGS